MPCDTKMKGGKAAKFKEKMIKLKNAVKGDKMPSKTDQKSGYRKNK